VVFLRLALVLRDIQVNYIPHASTYFAVVQHLQLQNRRRIFRSIKLIAVERTSCKRSQACLRNPNLPYIRFDFPGMIVRPVPSPSVLLTFFGFGCILRSSTSKRERRIRNACLLIAQWNAVKPILYRGFGL